MECKALKSRGRIELTGEGFSVWADWPLYWSKADIKLECLKMAASDPYTDIADCSTKPLYVKRTGKTFNLRLSLCRTND
jgi:hypothetical protein